MIKIIFLRYLKFITMTSQNNSEIIFENVSYTYPGEDTPAIKNINLKINKGELVLITGPAGAGKTTLCCCLNGIVPHFYGKEGFEGDVYVRNMNTRDYDIASLSKVSGLLFQDPEGQLICPTVEAEIAFGPENFGVDPEEIEKRVKELITIIRLEGYGRQNPHSLSGGQKQSCALASVISMHPEIYILDEPTSELDPLGSEIILNEIKKSVTSEKKTLILVEHKLTEVSSLVDRIIVMNEGEIILDDNPIEVFKNAKLMNDIGLRVPHASLLASQIRRMSLDMSNPITVEEAVTELNKLVKENRMRLIAGPDRGDEGTRGTDSDKKVLIKVEDLWHVYPNGTEALKGVSLEIREGEFVSIIGQNGSGKTTLVKHFNGLLKPTKGNVVVFGIDASKASIEDLSRHVGYCFQNPDHQLFCKTVKEEISYGPKNFKLKEEEIEERLREVTENLQLEHLVDKTPWSLSKGEKQRVAVASALSMKPQLLVIDEPTTGQDFQRSKDLMDLAKRLNREGTTVIVITHDMNIVSEYSPRTVVLKNGKKLLDGPTRHVFSQPEVIKETFLKPPEITQISQALEGVPDDVLSIDEFLHHIEKAEAA